MMDSFRSNGAQTPDDQLNFGLGENTITIVTNGNKCHHFGPSPNEPIVNQPTNQTWVESNKQLCYRSRREPI